MSENVACGDAFLIQFLAVVDFMLFLAGG